VSKQLIVCCDGTWQNINSIYPTNVAKLFQAIPVSSDNLVFYGEGVGTGNWADRVFGGALGWGLDNNIQDAYRFLCSNYATGDRIYLFGFSRGAYTVRSLVGLIRAVGILPRLGIRHIPKAYKAYQDAKSKPSNRRDLKLRETDEQLQKFRQDSVREYGDDYHAEVEITFLGCWDTVGALGIPDQLPWLPLDQIINRKYQFHNTKLSSKILHARHAVSIDENRKEFDVTRMEPAENAVNQVNQVWFPGGHGCIGGGAKANSPLANAALLWMMDEVEALNLGLKFNRSQIEDGVETDPSIFFPNNLAFPYTLNDRKILNTDPLHSSVDQRWQTCDWYRPKSLKSISFKPKLSESSQLTADRSLAVGQKVEFVVMAQEFETDTSIIIENGASYTIRVSPRQVWQQAQICSNAAGWTIERSDRGWHIRAMEIKKISDLQKIFYQLSQNLTRLPQAEWMELLFEIAGEKYRIDLLDHALSLNFNATTSGKLIAYANDVPGFHQNNQGWIFATITRTN
jgi:uncharacterized protein (DUF2235 family)